MKTLEQYAALVNDHIATLPLDAKPAGLYEPITYTMALGGKRLRPVLALAAADAVSRSCDIALDTALAVETFHNFTLLHDDIMDRSDTRRGKPTVYRRWGEAAAILSGDAMLTIATDMLMRPADIAADVKLRLYGEFSRVAMDVYRGQQYDMEFETRDDVTVDEYIEMISLKTGALLGGACSLGAITVSADGTIVKAFYDYGLFLGIAFQLQDDLLDSFGDAATFGKPIGGDILNDKKTWLNITARAESPAAMAAANTLDGRDKIDAVKHIYTTLDLPRRCESLVNRYLEKAIASVASLGLTTEATRFFSDFARSLIGRKK